MSSKSNTGQPRRAPRKSPSAAHAELLQRVNNLSRLVEQWQTSPENPSVYAQQNECEQRQPLAALGAKFEGMLAATQDTLTQAIHRLDTPEVISSYGGQRNGTTKTKVTTYIKNCDRVHVTAYIPDLGVASPRIEMQRRSLAAPAQQATPVSGATSNAAPDSSEAPGLQLGSREETTVDSEGPGSSNGHAEYAWQQELKVAQARAQGATSAAFIRLDVTNDTNSVELVETGLGDWHDGSGGVESPTLAGYQQLTAHGQEMCAARCTSSSVASSEADSPSLPASLSQRWSQWGTEAGGSWPHSPASDDAALDLASSGTGSPLAASISFLNSEGGSQAGSPLPLHPSMGLQNEAQKAEVRPRSALMALKLRRLSSRTDGGEGVSTARAGTTEESHC